MVFLLLGLGATITRADSFEAAKKGQVKGDDAEKFDQVLQQLVLTGNPGTGARPTATPNPAKPGKPDSAVASARDKKAPADPRAAAALANRAPKPGTAPGTGTVNTPGAIPARKK